MKGSDGQRADSHGGLIAQQHGAYPLPGLHKDTLDTPDARYHIPLPTVSHACPVTIYGNPNPYAELDKPAARTLSA